LDARFYNAAAHTGLGGAGTAACSGDLLLGALSACAQITCQMVAAAMGIVTERIEVAVEGDLDLRGTLGIAREVAVGFERVRVRFGWGIRSKRSGPPRGEEIASRRQDAGGGQPR
jgi:hypothetical protein